MQSGLTCTLHLRKVKGLALFNSLLPQNTAYKMSSHSRQFLYPRIAMMAIQCSEEGSYVIKQYSESKKKPENSEGKVGEQMPVSEDTNSESILDRTGALSKGGGLKSPKILPQP